MFLPWIAPVASGTRLARFLAASCSSSALFLRCTCLQASFWRLPERIGRPFGRSGGIFFHRFSRFSVLARARGNNGPILRKPQFLLCGTYMAVMASMRSSCTTLHYATFLHYTSLGCKALSLPFPVTDPGGGPGGVPGGDSTDLGCWNCHVARHGGVWDASCVVSRCFVLV